MRVMENKRKEGRRRTDSEASRAVDRVLIWPWGGLAFGVVPHALTFPDPSGAVQSDSRASSGPAD